ncbi:MAG: hypothetical protein M3R53_05185 [Candidatus Eremiobacteraeota bacterium]|nr:hypothetical protein [Candidatus Eremiobacteraeota bacterium]
MTHTFESNGYAFVYNDGLAGEVRLVRLPGTPSETHVNAGEFAIAGNALAAFALHAAQLMTRAAASDAEAPPVPEPIYDFSGDFVLEGEGKAPS